MPGFLVGHVREGVHYRNKIAFIGGVWYGIGSLMDEKSGSGDYGFEWA